MKPEHAAQHPIKTAAWSFGVLRGLAASVIRIASGERGPVIPGYLPGPVAAPVEENVKHEDVVRFPVVDAPQVEAGDEQVRGNV